MARTFPLQIVTPERVILDGPVTSVTAPGVEGAFTVLAGHAPLVAELGIGELRYRDERGAEQVMALHAGFLQVARDRTTVLADAAERPEEIDLERARRAQEKALEEQRTIALRFNEAENTRIRADLDRSQNRVRIAGRGRS
jgi:F-type H+-transporting ATPase subunit epsilon